LGFLSASRYSAARIAAVRGVAMKIATILLGILDVAAAIVVAVIIYAYADEAFLGLDQFLLWAVPILCIITAVPALWLALKSQRRKTALVLALAFPVGFLAELVGVFLYFTYVM
jgi:hypothetical protein